MISKVLSYVVALLIWEFLKKQGYVNKFYNALNVKIGGVPEPVPPVTINGGIE